MLVARSMSRPPDLDGPDRIAARASAIVRVGGLDQALTNNILPTPISLTLAEALVLGLLKQGVRNLLTFDGGEGLGDYVGVYNDPDLIIIEP